MKAFHKDPSKAGTKKTKARSQTISIAYDREADVLSLTFGDPQKQRQRRSVTGFTPATPGKLGGWWKYAFWVSYSASVSKQKRSACQSMQNRSATYGCLRASGSKSTCIGNRKRTTML